MYASAGHVERVLVITAPPDGVDFGAAGTPRDLFDDRRDRAGCVDGGASLGG